MEIRLEWLFALNELSKLWGVLRGADVHVCVCWRGKPCGKALEETQVLKSNENECLHSPSLSKNRKTFHWSAWMYLSHCSYNWNRLWALWDLAYLYEGLIRNKQHLFFIFPGTLNHGAHISFCCIHHPSLTSLQKHVDQPWIETPLWNSASSFYQL